MLKQYEYSSYDEYRFEQIERNRAKINRVWAKEDSIRAIAAHLLKRLDPIERGICHGTRRGDEIGWFRKALSCDVIGTEISDTAKQFPHTIQHDFHDVKPDWIGAFDFVYSNSFDHAFDPKRALTAWMNSLRAGGLCIIEWSRQHGPQAVTRTDPFGAELSDMPGLVKQWGPFQVREILDLPDIERQSKALFVEAI